ncbi:hypothetical protein HK102_005839, partial [Quaeritorhiza haematococci]
WSVEGDDIDHSENTKNRNDVVRFFRSGSRYQLPNDGKVLFVVNHNLHAADMAALFATIFLATGKWSRGLADTTHTFVPGWAQFLFYIGGIPGTRENCAECMKAGHPLLVFPGGHLEVFRRKTDPKYHVIWKEIMGFAKLAVAHGYTIIPSSSVGMGDMLRAAFEVPIPDIFLMIMGDKRRGLFFPIPIPVSLERQYMKFSKAIPTDSSQSENMEYIKEIRNLSRDAVNVGIDKMVEWQKQDPNRYMIKPWF